MDWFTIAVIAIIVLGVVSSAFDLIVTRKLRQELYETQMMVYGFSFQLARLEEIEAKSVKVTRTNATKEAK